MQSRRRLAVAGLRVLARLAWCLALCSGASRAGYADWYDCGPGDRTCVAAASWVDDTGAEYFGTFADVDMTSMSCAFGCSGGYISNEIGMADTRCDSRPFRECWLVAGYIATGTAPFPSYFWTEGRPTGSSMATHILGPAGQRRDTDHFMIVKDGRVQSPTRFLVFIYNDSRSTFYGETFTIPTGETLSANVVGIGQKLSGNWGAAAEPATFSRNIYAVQPLGPEYVFWYRRQTERGRSWRQWPVRGAWTIDPSTTPPPEGGKFETRCFR
jgi:hypothetical protein